MAADPTLQDPLLALRRAIAASSLPTPTTTPDLSAEAQQQQTTDDLATATHLYFQHPTPQTLPLTSATRFVSASSDSTVDLRSIFFAWQKKDVAIPEYIASAQELNEALKQKREGTEQVQNLVFVERLDLITWLEGASDDSEYIKPLEGAAAVAVAEAQAEAQAAAQSQAQAQASANIASGAAGGVSSVPSGAGAGAGQAAAGAGAPGAAGGRAAKPIDPRLQEIYNGERKMGDRNSVLRGIKPTVHSSFFDLVYTQANAAIRISRTYAKPQKASWAATTALDPAPEASVAPPTSPAAKHLWDQAQVSHCPRNTRAADTPTPSSSSPPPPRLLSA